MRNDIPQIETREIADADLDNVSGGIGVAAEGVGGVAGTSVGGNVSAGVEGLDSVTGVASGAVPGAVSTVTGLAGL